MIAIIIITLTCITAVNFVITTADDLGTGDIKYAPFIQELSQKSTVYNHVWGASVCAPSRYMLFTGIETYKSDIKGNSYKNIVPQNNFIIKMQERNYTTIISGKYGFGSITTGFDKSYILASHKDAHFAFPKYVLENNRLVQLNKQTNKRLCLSGKCKSVDTESLKFTLKSIEENKDKKFIIYDMPLYNHINTFNGKNYGYFVDNYENISTIYNDDYRGYLAMIIKFDKRVKEIYNKLEDLKILEQTVLIITSDNGAELYYERGRPTSKDPFNSKDGRKGNKRSMYEGGLNVPFIMYLKNRKPEINNTPFTFAKVSNLIENIINQQSILINKDKFIVSEYCEQRCSYAILDTTTFDKLIYQNNRYELYNIKSDPFEKKIINNITISDYLKNIEFRIKNSL